ncbi:uncharacterized protein BO66DRAFT_206238 [Aspergillus aculeatinus CBS 121060]|uniref:Uncharacterized protein n=1 Tax=Aspergillus aculeatinus CBS 121060 TaxID=1448322 RepID=A0ACD1GWC2_9EURO|nr:hypothetical protein BO66DRAFT_206238 [Aspergillus aculeatinus CBS 121060]RAH65582.1 hypothetical protein BO66DRAFT_206238 [Aspergillus aculeatinus CBS 121060]
MFFFLISTVWLLLSTGFPTVSAAASSCDQNVQNDTIAFFSSAPLTFGYNFPSISDCATRCSQWERCQAWLFTQPGECQLYRRPALATASNPTFSYGVCGDTDPLNSTINAAASRLTSVSMNPSSSSPTASLSGSHAAVPSSHEASVTPGATIDAEHLRKHKRYAGSHHRHGHAR